MAKCVRCARGGAKRICPALEGVLCARCCAQHQGRDIDCPKSCSFLRRSSGKDYYQAAVAKLLTFAYENEAHTGSAFLRVAGRKKMVGEWEEPLVVAYAVYGYTDAQGQRAIDVLLREQRENLKVAEVEALEALQHTAWPSLFEVQAIELDAGIHFVDLITGDALYVREKLATHCLKKFDVTLGWFVRLGDHIEMTGAGVAVPRGHLKVVLEATNKEMRRLREASPQEDRVLLREAVVVTQQTLRTAVESWEPPKMRTMDGEEIVFCESVFEVSDVEATRDRLAAHPDMEVNHQGFSWVDRKGRAQLGDGALHLGSIRLEGGRLTLETQSRERLERGTHLLTTHLAGVARHRLDAIKDMDVALKGMCPAMTT